MATTEQPKVATEEAKIDLFEDDDEFEEFDINRVWDTKEEGKEVGQQWEDDWDDDDVNDDFSLQLKKELENNVEKKCPYTDNGCMDSREERSHGGPMDRLDPTTESKVGSTLGLI